MRSLVNRPMGSRNYGSTLSIAVIETERSGHRQRYVA